MISPLSLQKASATQPAVAIATPLLVADGTCPQIRELLAAAEAPVLWLDGQEPPLQAVSRALAERRQLGQPVDTLHWVSHGRAGTLLVGDTHINKGTLIAHAQQLADWRITSTALWSCEAGGDLAFTSLWEELTGASLWATKNKLGRIDQNTCNWELTSKSDQQQPIIPIRRAWLATFEATLTAQGSQAEVIIFPAGITTTQTTPTQATADSNTVQTGYVNADWDATSGVKIDITQTGTASIGFASEIPQNYSGPGATYLYDLEITDQDGNILFDESFDNWTAVSAYSFDTNTGEGIGEYTADNTWEVWANSSSIFTGYGLPFDVKTESGDNGIVYPMDGAGPFGVLSSAQFNIPDGTTSIYVNPTWGYDVNIFSPTDEDRSLWVGFKYGDVAAKELFSFVQPADATAPTLDSSNPADDATNVAIDANIVLTFSESVVAGTGNITIKKSADDSTVATIDVSDAQVSVSGDTVTINPAADLDGSTGYYIEIDEGALQDAAGNNYTGFNTKTTLNFTTADITAPAPTSAPSADITAPAPTSAPSSDPVVIVPTPTPEPTYLPIIISNPNGQGASSETGKTFTSISTVAISEVIGTDEAYEFNEQVFTAINVEGLADNYNIPIEVSEGLDSETPTRIVFSLQQARQILDIEEVTEGGGTVGSNAPSGIDLLINGVYFNSSAGNDDLTGSIFNDFIRAGAGDDIINAGDGDDLVRGGTGSDQITLGAGADTVYYTIDQLDGSTDTITDFSAEDQIRLGEGIQIASLSDDELVLAFTEDGITRQVTVLASGLSASQVM